MEQANNQNEYMKRLECYRLAMALAKGMLSRKIITEAEYAKIDTIMAKKYEVHLFTFFH